MKRGVSLATVAIVIVILTILLGIIIPNGRDSVDLANINMFAVEILNVQTAVDEYYLKNNTYPLGDAVSFDVANVDEVDKYQFVKETATSELIELKKVDLELLGISDTEFGNNKNVKDVYVLSEISGRVYYLQGVKYQEKTYYTIDDELYNTTGIDKLDVLTVDKDVKNQHIIFSPSETKYTSSPIVVTIKIPVDANFIDGTSDGKDGSEITTVGAYKQLVVNETGSNREGNYNIYVKYSYKNSIYEATYNVTNFDNTKPTVTLSETESNQAVLVNVVASDDLSGIKTIKYVEGVIEDAEYFKLYGKNVLNNKFNIGKYTSYSVYVEDNAGNYKIVTKTATLQTTGAE